MADIELVIKIPEADYECLMNTTFVANLELWRKQSAKDRQQTKALFALVDALHDGKPLPKGHGRLIDADDIDNHIIGHVDTRSCPTIIESDRESE